MSLVDDDFLFYPEKKHDVSQLTGGGVWDDWLDSKALNQLVFHPLLSDMRERKLTLSDMRYFLVQHHHYSRNFVRFLCSLISNIQSFDDAKHLMENLLEELGVDDDGKVTHAELFQRSLQAVGGSAASFAPLHETRHFSSAVLDYCRSGEVIDGLAALCLGAEAIVPLIYKPVLDALTDLGIEEEGLEFFRLHIEDDESHALTMLHILDKMIGGNKQQAQRVRDVGRNAILLRCKMFDAVYQHIQEENLRATNDSGTFETLESAVRSYCRIHPAVFDTAKNAKLFDSKGASWIDFLSGAGSLNYGHNNPVIKKDIMDYVARDGITHSLDLHTRAKKLFIDAFNEIILTPRNLHYRFQFTGPTGANAVEAAMKIARKFTGRSDIVAFTNAFHGMSLGALAATARENKRGSAGVSLNNIIRLPYENFLDNGTSSLDVIKKMLLSPGSGLDLPAAIILETVQGEGGVNIASVEWLQAIADLAEKNGILLIVDDIQAGCGRTGTFFSFEAAGITPDIVCLAKSISGYGLPMSLVLLKERLDIWQPGEHNGTFRGNNLAFIGAASALGYWQDDYFLQSLMDKSALISGRLYGWAERYPGVVAEVRGKGMIWGVECCNSQQASAMVLGSGDIGLIIESCGPENKTIKLLPPLTIEIDVLEQGLLLLEEMLEKNSLSMPA